MKIGIVSTIANGFGKKGFYNGQELGLAKELAKRGHEITIYKYAPNTESAVWERPTKNISVHTVPCKKFGVHGLMKPSVLDDDLQAVVMFSDTQLATRNVYRWCKKHKIPFIPYVGIAQSTIRGKFIATFMDAIFKYYTLPVYKHCNPICKTQIVADSLEKYGIHGCTVANAGLDFSIMKQEFQNIDRNAIRQELGCDEHTKLILCVARLEPHKHPQELVEIFQHIHEKQPDTRLVLIGEGPLKDDLSIQVNNLNLDKYIQMPGRIPYDQMWKWYYAADIYVNLSEIEIFGMAIMEAVYYHTMVVAMKGRGPQEILKQLNGCVICNDFQEVEKHLLSALPKQEVLEENAKILQQVFSWKNCANVIERRVKTKMYKE